MATEDISRAAFDARKHYAAVRMQQGRVIVDDDWNEAATIEAEDDRRSLADVIGPAGSPDQGFRITAADFTNNQIDFDILPGTFYLGGLRVELERKQSYREQTDWLQGPDGPAAPSADRVDLVYLEVFQEPVGPVEDSELFEVALGGPDTSMRLRTVPRVRVLQNIPAECDDAWDRLEHSLAGMLNGEDELITAATLKVSYKSGGTPQNLCTPSVAGGYLGAENQAIRVQLVTADSFTWGFDNAAPLYRVELDAARKKVTLTTEPRDQAHWPLAGQIVEILPWSAVLPNGEKVAGAQGHLTRVDASYDPDTRQLTLTGAVPVAGFEDWRARSDASDLQKPSVYYFLRVWNRGSDRASAPAIPLVAGTPVDLGQTGLQVTFGGTSRTPGDYWIIAARPETPRRVVPWDLEQGRRPHGVRRYYAPLAVIEWHLHDGVLQRADVTDCRRTFRPLTQQKTCCTLTVGDGRISHGDFNSLADALRRLPDDGGQICLLPGIHTANARIEGRSNIRISGCPGRTLVVPGPHEERPIFLVKDSDGIILETMDLLTLQGSAIVVEGSAPGKVQNIEIGSNRIVAFKNAIHVMQGSGINIHHNLIRMLDKEGGDVAIFILADDALVERNDLSVVPAGTVPGGIPGHKRFPDPTDPCADLEGLLADRRYVRAYAQLAWTVALADFARAELYHTLGGIQIGSGSERVEVLRNRIAGGAGNGITLGSDLDPADLPPEAETGEPETPEVTATGPAFEGKVEFEGKAVAGVPVMLQSAAGRPLMTATDEQGRFALKNVEPGASYQVAVSAPHRMVSRVRSGEMVHIVLADAPPEAGLARVLDFITDVVIDENEIAGMGLSGIGFPRAALDRLGDLARLRKFAARKPVWTVLFILARYFGVLNGFNVNVTIEANHIHDCLLSAAQADATPALIGRGVGGISLGLCENLRIVRNRVENNGANQLGPVCGVYVLFTDQLDAGDNHVLGNGPARKAALHEGGAGLRGGIVVLLATALGVTARLAPSEGPVSKGGHAARIYDNVVSQPLGRALTLGAFGPGSILDNRFHTLAAGPGAVDRLVGAVLVLNLGGALDIARLWQAARRDVGAGQENQAGAEPAPPAGADTSGGPAPVEMPMGGWAAMNVPTVGYGERVSTALTPGMAFPGGHTLFGGNQTQLGAARPCAAAQLVATAGDLGFNDNECAMLARSGEAPQVNTLLGGATVRGTSSRFAEVIELQGRKLSLLTLGLLMNNTSGNQGNHCTVALCLAALVSLAPKLVAKDNQALLASAASCAGIARGLRRNPRRLAAALVGLMRRSQS